MTKLTQVATLRPLQYPSDELPGVPPFEIGVPAGWALDDHAGRLAMMVDCSSSPTFLVNVMVGADRVPPELTLDELVPEMETAVHQPRIGTIAGMPVSARLQALAVEGQDLALAQLQVLLFGPRRTGRTKHLFYLHATCLADDVERYLPLFTEVARSFRFLEAGAI